MRGKGYEVAIYPTEAYTPLNKCHGSSSVFLIGSSIQGNLQFEEDATFLNNKVHPNPDKTPANVRGGAIYNSKSGRVVFKKGLHMESNTAEVRCMYNCNVDYRLQESGSCWYWIIYFIVDLRKYQSYFALTGKI